MSSLIQNPLFQCVYSGGSKSLLEQTPLFKRLVEALEALISRFLVGTPDERKELLSNVVNEIYVYASDYGTNQFRNHELRVPYRDVLVDLEKKISSLIFLPSIDFSNNDAEEFIPNLKRFMTQSRWALIRDLIGINDPIKGEKRGPAKMIQEAYFKEFRFKGDNDLSLWMSQDLLFHHWTQHLTIPRNGIPYATASRKVKYLTDYELERLKIEIKEGLFYSQNRLLTTDNSLNPSLDFIYVLNKSGEFFIAQSGIHGNFPQAFHHSSFLSGKPALCAGTLTIEQGKLISISNQTGHYEHDAKALMGLLKMFYAQGVDLSRTQITLINPTDEDKQYALDTLYARNLNPQLLESKTIDWPRTVNLI